MYVWDGKKWAAKDIKAYEAHVRKMFKLGSDWSELAPAEYNELSQAE